MQSFLPAQFCEKTTLVSGCGEDGGCHDLFTPQGVCGEMVCGNGCEAEGCGSSCNEGCNGRGISQLDGGFEYGRENVLLDGIGWVAGIPAKLTLWNSKVDSHSVSPEVAGQMKRYMAAHQLDTVKVRVNQYDPMGEFARLKNNKAIHPGIRYTFGAFALTRYTLTPGRIFGADSYNPFTNTISLYSDRASLALREAAKAKNVQNSSNPNLHVASMQIPGSPLWIDYWATRDVVRWAKETRQRKLERESYLVLFPAYGDSLARSMTAFVDVGQGQAMRSSLALVGHAVGRTMALRVSEGPVEIVKTLNGIVRKPEGKVPTIAHEPQEPAPEGAIYPVSFQLQPVDVSYVPTNWRR